MTGTFQLTPDAERIAANLRLLLVPTSPDDEAFARTRAAALQIARGTSTRVVLYDRSDERWTDTPHPEGPFALDEIDLDKREHLASQMQPFTDAGVDVVAWYASVPALTAIISAVQELDADSILVPEELDKPRVMDRLQAGDDAGEMIGRVLDQNLERPVHLFVLADDSDSIEVMTTEDRTQRPEAAPSEADA